MKRIKIEIQVILLTISIAAAVIFSGYLVFQSLSQIVDTIHKEARPDLKLLLVKEIASDLNEVENTVRLYSLTGDENFIKSFRKLNKSIHSKLSDLTIYAVRDTIEKQQIDSIRILTNRKLIIWDKIRILHGTKINSPDSLFTKLYSKLDTAIVEADTVAIKPEPKKGFFRRVFGKRDTTKRSIVIDKSHEKEMIKQEIAGAEKSIADQTRQLQERDKALLEQNIQVSKILNQIISRIEISEQIRLKNKTREADSMAEKTYRRLAAFTIAAVVLLLLVLIVVIRNIQHNRTYQKALRKAKGEAEGLARAKETFVATVSHEMRTPVNAIYGLTEQMLHKAGSDEMAADLQVVYKSAEHLISMVNDTLDFSRIESQKLKIERIDFLPEEIFQEVYVLHKNSAGSKGIDLIINNQIRKNTVLKGDPFRLKQILINLISNAIKFTSYGQVSVSASGEERSDNTFLLKIEITDTGVGISETDLQRIFDEFVQLDTDLTQKHRGTGLGLAIVKKLIDLQNGHIEVDSIPGKGTHFIFQIPYQKGQSRKPTITAMVEPDIPDYFKNLRILVVDDEEFNLYFIKNILQKWGVNHTEAHNGKEATELADEETYDLILLDIRMPVMDGYEAASLILKRQPNTRIIALTADNKPVDEQKSRQAGIHLFLQKPFSEMKLFEAVTSVLPTNPVSEEQTTSTELPAIDLDELERMSGDDEAFFSEMLRIFIHSSETGLETIQAGFKTNDWNALRETAHKLAAPSKHLHAKSLYNNLKKLENIAEKGKDRKETDQLIREITLEISKINTFLKQKLGEE